MRVFAIGLAWLVSVAALGADSPCPADRIDTPAISEHVYDGDTLRLRDGRRVRLIGIDTPEIGRNGQASEPLAEAARAALTRLLPHGAQIGLRYGAERRDHYGRWLAHVYLADGRNVQAHLLERGLAFALVVAPNTPAQSCYALAERAAREAGRGVWQVPRYAPVEAAALSRSAAGFAIEQGRVARVGESRDNWWLNLTRGFAVRVPKAALVAFDDYHPADLQGRRVEVRGWLVSRKGELRITVRHPAALVPID